MTPLSFLMEWGIRSAMVVCAGALMMKALGTKDSSVRLAGWTAILCGSLLLPLLIPMLPRLGVPVWQRAGEAAVSGTIDSGENLPVPGAGALPRAGATLTGGSFDFSRLLLVVYSMGAGAMFLRLFLGLFLGRRLRLGSRPTGGALPGGVPIHESEALTAPATLGILRPVVVLPADWRAWDAAKREAVLAHEGAHIQRFDPLVQLASAVHRALLWWSPASWLLDTHIVRLAEDASDDAALATTRDRTRYAEVLLEFIERGIRRTPWAGVAMARYGNADERIHRILEGTVISRGVTRLAMVVILGLAVPFVYLAASLSPEAATSPRQAPATATGSTAATSASATTPASAAAPVQAAASSSPAREAPQTRSSRERINRYLIFSKDSMSGSWDSRDRVKIDDWKARFGTDFAWFRHNGTDYIVTDASVLDRLHDAMAPQREVNRQQAEVNRHQAGVNSQQATVNDHQAEVNRLQGEVNRQQGEVNDRQRSGRSANDEQARVNQMQSGVNARQATVNQEQDFVNGLQKEVNGEQAKVNAEQHRIQPQVEQGIQDALESALDKGVARPVR